MFHSIRWRIALPFILMAVATMLAMSLYLSNTIRQEYVRNLRSQLTDEAALLADMTAPLMRSPDARGQLATLAQHYGGQLGARVTIISPSGAVLADSLVDATTLEDHLNRPEVQQALQAGAGYSLRASSTTGQIMMYSAARIGEYGAADGVVRLAVRLSEVNDHISTINRTLIAATLGAQILIMIIAILVAERTTLPVRRLIDAVEEMARGNLGIRILPMTSDELGRLSEAFNNMAGSVETQMGEVVDQRNKLVTVLTHMTDGALIADRDGRVQLVNPAALRLLNWGDENPTGASLVAVVRDHQIVAIWQRSRQTGKEQSDVVELGSRGAFLRVVATPVQEPSEGGSLIILQDLTQVRRLETIRRDFISNISHELRNPLAALKALVDTLRDGALDDRPMAERFLTQIEAEVDSMTQMVRELLELSRIESGRVPLHIAATPVSAIIGPAVERLRSQADRAGLTIDVDVPDDLPPAQGDSERLQQVMSNLLHNAIKFTPPGGRITVSARKDDRLVISVQDTGVGIAKADLSRIFERFYKADRARSGGGTGLGLAIAKHVVQAHGGQIWAESAEGHGATFHFTLPVAPSR